MSKRKPNNAWLAKKQAEKAAEQAARSHVDIQMALDSAVIAANNTFHRKGDIMLEFVEEFNKVFKEISLMLIDDAKDDEELWYSKSKIDSKLNDIFGEENVAPWDVRYDYTRCP
jgi:hypothetical protein